MKHKKTLFFIINIIFVLFTTTQDDTLPTIPTQIFGEHIWHQHYQDELEDGIVVTEGRVPEQEKRYQIIKKYIAKYNRPITAIDLGASQGYYSLRLAQDFPASTFVMVEEDPYLKTICHKNKKLSNIIFLNKRINIKELEELGACEHFDVVLALQVIHWSLDAWKETTNAIINLGDMIFIELPPKEETTAIGGIYLSDINTYCVDLGSDIIAQFPRHTNSTLKSNLYLLNNKKKSITHSYWNAEEKTKKYTIKSTKKEKLLKRKINKDTIETVWIPGINLCTFMALNGTYPTYHTLLQSLLQWEQSHSTPKEPIEKNILIQGNNLIPVPLTTFSIINTNYSSLNTTVDSLLYKEQQK